MKTLLFVSVFLGTSTALASDFGKGSGSVNEWYQRCSHSEAPPNDIVVKIDARSTEVDVARMEPSRSSGSIYGIRINKTNDLFVTSFYRAYESSEGKCSNGVKGFEFRDGVLWTAPEDFPYITPGDTEAIANIHRSCSKLERYAEKHLRFWNELSATAKREALEFSRCGRRSENPFADTIDAILTARVNDAIAYQDTPATLRHILMPSVEDALGYGHGGGGVALRVADMLLTKGDLPTGLYSSPKAFREAYDRVIRAHWSGR